MSAELPAGPLEPDIAEMIPDPVRREHAFFVADKLIEIMFRGRRGHGGKPGTVYRQMSREELAVQLVLAFEAGARWEENR